MLTPEQYSELIEKEIARIEYPAVAPGLYDPIRYTLDGGGKRLRPMLLMAAAEAYGAEPQQVVPQAVGIEMFHNFTLLHDDVMDNADVRRGRPTVHRRWNPSAAILSGDAMLTMASEMVARGAERLMGATLSLFNTTAMEIYQGQQLDMEFEDRADVTVGEYMEMIRLKTSVLLACACAMGALRAGAPGGCIEAMYRFGERLGLAFQLKDDYLDTYGDPALFGKEIGGDIVNEKKTWLWINAMAERPAEMKAVLAKKLTDFLKVREITAIYDALDLPSRSHALIERYADEAVAALRDAQLPPEAYRFFSSLALRLTSRSN